MSPTSGVGGDETTDAFFNDMLSKPRPPPPQAPAATPPPPAAAAGIAGSTAPTVRSRRPAAPPGAKRPVGGSSAASRPTTTAGQRKPVSARPSAPTAATTVKPPSYYLNNDATTTANSSNNNSNHNRENINPAATQMFYSPAAPSVVPQQQHQPNSAPTSYYGAPTAGVGGAADPSSDWYTPSTMSVMAPVHHVEQHQQQQPTIMNPYMPQPLGSMDTLSASHSTDASFLSGEDPYANEPPLMEELGINVEHIAWKTRAVVLPFSRWVVRMRNRGFQQHDDDDEDHPMLNPQLMAQDADLAGPIAFAVLLGAELLLAGKLQFGYIYGFGLFGCLSMTLILNLLQPLPEVARLTSDPTILPVPTAATSGISFWSVTSILGYSLLPVNVLAAFKLLLVNNPFWKLHTLLRISAVITIAWSTIASTRLFEQGFGFRHQRYLIAYPIALLYSAFVLITTF